MGDKFYVYMYMKDDNPLYIGRTKNLCRRLTTHCSKSKFYHVANRIMIMEFDNTVDHQIAEMHLISAMQPKYNKGYKDGIKSKLDIQLPDFEELTIEKLKGMGEVRGEAKYERNRIEKMLKEFTLFKGNGFKQMISPIANRRFVKGNIEIKTVARSSRYEVSYINKRRPVAVSEEPEEAYRKALELSGKED